MSWDSPPPADDQPALPPEWFEWALAQAPERGTVMFDGAAIETLVWGARGKPGLLLMHGNSACADWWSFIAPFFAADYRVTAFSWSGMGRSDHRDSYSFEALSNEMFAVAEATGLFDAGPPLAVGHSFGGYAMMTGVQRIGELLRGAVIVDTPFTEVGEPNRHRPPAGVSRPHRPHASLDHAVARFRLMPPQLCDNESLTDYIARQSVVEVPDAETGEAGWIWRFDPDLMAKMEAFDADRDMLAAPRCPVALVWGDRSALMPPDRVAKMRARLPAGAPAIEIPDADHHVMLDQPLALVAALRALFTVWP